MVAALEPVLDLKQARVLCCPITEHVAHHIARSVAAFYGLDLASAPQQTDVHELGVGAGDAVGLVEKATFPVKGRFLPVEAGGQRQETFICAFETIDCLATVAADNDTGTGGGQAAQDLAGEGEVQFGAVLLFVHQDGIER